MTYDIGDHLAEPGPGGTRQLTPKAPEPRRAGVHDQDITAEAALRELLGGAR